VIVADATSKSVGDADDHLERDILALLNSSGSPRLLSVSEIAQGIGDTVAVTDAIDRLHKFGVVHRCGEFVLITRTAARACRLAEL
jgi:hypothetical protein